MARKRHISRIVVMQVLFEREQHDCDLVEALDRNLEELGNGDTEYAHQILTGVIEKESDVREAIAKHAPDWSLDRMDPIARCTLLVGAYELLCIDDVPDAVVMNEAIEIAKDYGSPESGKFVNGVLNAIAHAA